VVFAENGHHLAEHRRRQEQVDQVRIELRSATLHEFVRRVACPLC
jgi:hypothetical protein